MKRLAVTLAVLLPAPASAGAHSLVRVNANQILYLSQDATSLNTLVVRDRGGRVELRDPTVDGGADPGPCNPGDTSDAPNFWLIQVFCPRAGVTALRIDLGEREDTLTVTSALPAQVLGGPGADRLTTAAAKDTLDAGDGNDRVVAGAGGDTITGGLGVDDVSAGPGDDDVRVRDGLPDTVACGDGADRVDADNADEVAGDRERVSRTATAPPPDSEGTGADRDRPQVDVSALTLQRLGSRGTVKVVATSSERGTIGASGFVDIAGLSLPMSNAAERVPVPGAGVEPTIRLTGRQLREARRAPAGAGGA